MFKTQSQPDQRVFFQEIQAAAPGSSDDASAGFSIGDWWLSTSGPTAYVCLDASSGAAIWINVSRPCFSRDISSMTIPTRTTCFGHAPLLTGTLTIQGDGTFLVH